MQLVRLTKVRHLLPARLLTSAKLRKLKLIGAKGFSGGEYMGLIHPATEYDLMSESTAGGWLDVNKYTSATPAMKGEVGKLWNIRFMLLLTSRLLLARRLLSPITIGCLRLKASASLTSKVWDSRRM
jgi:hypothetical protein